MLQFVLLFCIISLIGEPRRKNFATMLEYNNFFAIIVLWFCYNRTKHLLRCFRRGLRRCLRRNRFCYNSTFFSATGSPATSGESGEVSGEIGHFFSVFWANRFLLHREQKRGLFAAAAAKAGLVGVARDLTARIDPIQRLATRGIPGKDPPGTPSGFLFFTT